MYYIEVLDRHTTQQQFINSQIINSGIKQKIQYVYIGYITQSLQHLILSNNLVIALILTTDSSGMFTSSHSVRASVHCGSHRIKYLVHLHCTTLLLNLMPQVQSRTTVIWSCPSHQHSDCSVLVRGVRSVRSVFVDGVENFVMAFFQEWFQKNY